MAGPYYTYQRALTHGYAVACAAHTVVEDVKEDEARALAAALNDEYQKRQDCTDAART